MPKIIKIVFVVLSVILVSALILACATVYKGGSDDESSVPPQSVSPSVDDSSEAPSSEAPSVDDSSEEPSSEEPSVDDSSEEPSSEEPSEDDSSEEPTPPVFDGSTDPITPPPAGITANENDAFFNDSLFVGHSVMVHFKNYVTNWRKDYDGLLGNAIFGCSSSFSFYNNIHQTPTQADSVLPKYQGQGYKIEDLVSVTGVKTVYVGLMGLNDLGMVGKPDTCASLVADEVKQCLELIKEKNPDVNIVVLSSTYLVRGINYPKLNNKNMSRLNSYILDYCNEQGIDFVDVATPLIDGGGYLAGVYCSDNYCHLKQNAYYVWMDVLRDYAAKKQSGTWQNPVSIPLFNN